MKTVLVHERLESRFALSASSVVPHVPAASAASHQAAHVHDPVQKSHVGLPTINNDLRSGNKMIGPVHQSDHHPITAVHRVKQ
jgi:hypothetical protein